MQMKTKLGRATAATLAAWIAVLNLLAQQPQKPSQPGYVVRVATEVVLVNVIARDKKGNLVRDLKKEDFTVYEDGRSSYPVSILRTSTSWQRPAAPARP